MTKANRVRRDLGKDHYGLFKRMGMTRWHYAIKDPRDKQLFAAECHAKDIEAAVTHAIEDLKRWWKDSVQ